MRIVHVGHGRLPIPPVDYGAVEDIIWNYKFHCERLGHEFLVVNDPDPVAAMWDAHNFNPDVIHLHDETKIDELNKIDTPVKIVTTHDPTFFEKRNPFTLRFSKGGFLIGCLSREQGRLFRRCGVPNGRMIDTPNGARSDLIHFEDKPAHPDRMICLGVVSQRKRQNLLVGIPFIDCIGQVAVYDPIVTAGVTFNSWNRQDVFNRLTDYAALVLLSKSEAAPLVVMEALMAGLDVIVSEAASANLDRTQPFVHVLPESTITNPTLLRITLENILKAPKNRVAVRKYAEQHHDWAVLAPKYLENLSRFVSMVAR